MHLKSISSIQQSILQMDKNEIQYPIWEVFIQTKPGQPLKHFWSVHAIDKEMAIEHAQSIYTRENEGFCLWVVPEKAIEKLFSANFDPSGVDHLQGDS
jgi:phenylacetate-CoA oxygenase PaaH subunit